MRSAKEGSFATLTHARLRALQGDVDGAKRILGLILDAEPGHHQAREMLSAMEGRVTVVRADPGEDGSVPSVTGASAAQLAGRFRGALGGAPPADRARRLSSWMVRVARNRGSRRVR